MTPLLQMIGMTKIFPGVQALSGVDFDLYPGEVHALIGENGAGKSTLMKIVAGVYQSDAGEMTFKGKRVRFAKPKDAQKNGVAVIYQELTLIPYLSIAENIFLSDEPTKALGFLDWNKMYEAASESLKLLNLELDPRTKVKDLGIAAQQLVEIAKALHHEADLIIMDEPTSALSPSEIHKLFEVVRSLTARGVGVIYISHHLDEVHEIGTRVTVMRDGKKVSTQKVEEVSVAELIRLMVGRTLSEQYPKAAAETGKELLRVENLSRQGMLEDISFTLHAGEVLGIAGLVGSGRTELARALFGADPIDKGKIFIEGREVKIRSPRDAIEQGMAFLTEDRKQQGLILPMSVVDNVTLTVLEKLFRFFTRRQEETSLVAGYVKNLAIKTPSQEQKVINLSGGNQQKVVLAKWLATKPKVLIFDEPTRGIDVGAKVEIYKLMNQLAAEGVGIVMISSELPEVLGMSDRVMVLQEGRVTGFLDKGEASQEAIMQYATGQTQGIRQVQA